MQVLHWNREVMKIRNQYSSIIFSVAMYARLFWSILQKRIFILKVLQSEKVLYAELVTIFGAICL